MTALWSAEALVAATNGALSALFVATAPGSRGRWQPARPAGPGRRVRYAQIIDAAFKAGAVGALVHRDAAGGPTLRVADTLDGLRALARFACARFAGRLAAVTGKASARPRPRRCCTILAGQGETSAAAASLNNGWAR